MKKLNLDSTKVLVISIILLLVVSISLIIYYNNRIDETNAKISTLNKEITSSLKKIETNIISLRNNLTLDIQLLTTNLKNFKKSNEEELNALTNLIDEIEKQSEIQLGELKEELKSIKVESKDFTAIIDDVIQSVVSIGTDKGLGSGAIIDDRGFIVTNYHVISNAKRIRVLTYEGSVYDAALIGYNDLMDIAVLKVDASLPNLRYGNSDNVAVGERVIALGNPAGLSFTVTEGIVSAVHRKGPNNLNIYLQTDVPINPGSSGGPLINANSRIIGINNFKAAGFEGLGFAIESNTVEQVADEIIEKYLQQIAE